ncbi:Mcm21p ASCRUDRAFT_23888, partial [Ascoidea rubescens DSM 1968]
TALLPDRDSKSQNLVIEDVLKSLKKKSIINKFNMESVYRMFGVTFFPLSDSTLSKLSIDSSTQDSKADESLLGIRFDFFNPKKNQFEIPHYIILKKNPKNGIYFIYKHTIPIFINL